MLDSEDIEQIELALVVETNSIVEAHACHYLRVLYEDWKKLNNIKKACRYTIQKAKQGDMSRGLYPLIDALEIYEKVKE